MYLRRTVWLLIWAFNTLERSNSMIKIGAHWDTSLILVQLFRYSKLCALIDRGSPLCSLDQRLAISGYLFALGTIARRGLLGHSLILKLCHTLLTCRVLLAYPCVSKSH